MFKKVLIVMVLLFTFTTSVSANTLYEVKKGDSLTKIAKQYKVTLNDLRTWNKLTKDSIYVKQKLIVQKPKVASTTTKATQKVAAANPVTTSKIDTPAQAVQVKAEELINNSAPILNEAKSLSSSGQAKYDLVVDFAKRMEGIPYLYGGNTMAGFDCSGFIYFVHSQAGLKVTRHSSESYFAQSSAIENPVVGDLVFFENTYKAGISHMGIYLGNNEFIHAGSKGVEIASLDSSYWKEHFVSFNRFHVVSE
ncbi:NlpC/P60 family protein [Psychrobacillus sp. FJAT-51614]|uniref:NlpC/P60 family protein n=1 Tax=Psychrobacillus mangrovi TaxID=3117745 RepID=A0ABU8F5V2_9BACI